MVESARKEESMSAKQRSTCTQHAAAKRRQRAISTCTHESHAQVHAPSCPVSGYQSPEIQGRLMPTTLCQAGLSNLPKTPAAASSACFEESTCREMAGAEAGGVTKPIREGGSQNRSDNAMLATLLETLELPRDG